MLRFIPLAVIICTASMALANVESRADLSFPPTENPMVREVQSDPENPLIVDLRDMTPGVDRFLLCPEPETIRASRSPMISGDVAAMEAVVAGQGCFVAVGGGGRLHAVHRGNVAAVRFQWLRGVEVDTGHEQYHENSGHVFWAHPHQVFLAFEPSSNNRIEPLIRRAFE